MPVKAPNYNVQSTSGLYFNYKTIVWIDSYWKLSTQDGFDMQWEIDSTDNGQPGTGWVTFYNIRPSLINQWKVNGSIAIFSGPPDLFGHEGGGRITKISQSPNGKDRAVTINFSEWPVYNNLPNIKDDSTVTKNVGKNAKAIYKTETVNKTHTTKGKPIYREETVTTKRGKTHQKRVKIGTSSPQVTVKHLRKRVKTGMTPSTRHQVKTIKQVNHTFPKNVRAKAIIRFIASKAKIKLGRCKLAKNNIYKRGYTLSARPFQALQQIANDCNSKLYYRNNQLVIDDGADPNPYHEHIFLSVGSGLTTQPVLTSKINKTPKQDQKTNQQKNQIKKQAQQNKQVVVSVYTAEAWDDPRVNAGSYARFQSQTLNNYCRIQSVKHKFSDDGYTMEMTLYA